MIVATVQQDVKSRHISILNVLGEMTHRLERLPWIKGISIPRFRANAQMPLWLICFHSRQFSCSFCGRQIQHGQERKENDGESVCGIFGHFALPEAGAFV